jgi:hypothetical protein
MWEIKNESSIPVNFIADPDDFETFKDPMSEVVVSVALSKEGIADAPCLPQSSATLSLSIITSMACHDFLETQQTFGKHHHNLQSSEASAGRIKERLNKSFR